MKRLWLIGVKGVLVSAQRSARSHVTTKESWLYCHCCLDLVRFMVYTHKSSISVSGGCGVNYWPSRTTLLTLAHPCMEKTLSLALRWIIVAVYISPLSWRQLSLQGNPWRPHRPALHSYRFGMSHDHRVFLILNPNNCILTECCANKHSACCTSEH